MRTAYEYTLTNEEFLRIVQHNQSRLTRNLPGYSAIRLLLLVICLALVFVAVQISILPGRGANDIANGLLVACAALVLLLHLQRRRITRHIADRCHLTVSPHALTVEEDGIVISSRHGYLKYFWPAFVRAEEYEGSVSLFLDNCSFYPVAASAFADAAEREIFLAHVRGRIAHDVRTLNPQALPATPRHAEAETAIADNSFTEISGETGNASHAAVSSPKPISAFRQNIDNAFRYAFFVRVAEGRLPVNWWQVVCFALLSMTVPVILAFAAIGSRGTWNWHSLPGALFHVPVLLFAAIVVACALPRLEKTQALFQAFLMTAFAVDLIYYGLFFAYYRIPAGFDPGDMEPSFFYGCALWTALACAVAAARLTGASVHTRLATLLISGLLIALPLATVYRDRSLWEKGYARENETAAVKRTDITDEDNFYRQPVLLEQALAAVRPQRKGVTEVFFIGMAGYGAEDVFRREIDSVTTLFRERFDADGHTIRLINNPKTAASAPIASVTSLRASLKRVAAVMDTEEDVLFLFLTSHGSETHRFALELWPLQFTELDPPTLRSLLDESGIKHRVVVISACYSGGFLNALRNDDTLVITASAPDRNSFGCGNENEWTYFGKAYFDEALRKTYSFTEAFDLATPVIAGRENKAQFTPSLPQMAIGRNIGATLARMQAQLVDP